MSLHGSYQSFEQLMCQFVHQLHWTVRKKLPVNVVEQTSVLPQSLSLCLAVAGTSPVDSIYQLSSWIIELHPIYINTWFMTWGTNCRYIYNCTCVQMYSVYVHIYTCTVYMKIHVSSMGVDKHTQQTNKQPQWLY